MAIEAQELTGSHRDNGRATAVDYPKVEFFAADVQHHRPGEPVGTIPLSLSESDIPHHAGANPNAKPKGSGGSEES
ncbi:MAG: hypothetical protein QOD49_283 [Actinomycetota bacterium]|jgi:hypothetical protein|nr:hypothetical protein [Actinomycetota bacterium]